MIAGFIEGKAVCDGVYCRGSFLRRKDRMDIYRLEEGGVWDAQRPLLFVIRQSDVELRVCGKVERDDCERCACDFSWCLSWGKK